jgi:phosphatidylinositol kinase/protein kinase (PI-3  family)
MQEHFPTPELWFEARTNFIKSSAIWSMVGYTIGLGDRHGDNILVHQHTGEISHVDFDCIFEKGLKLRVPEVVPFRMTSNQMDCLGLFREKGTFTRCCEIVLKMLRKNQRNIIGFLHAFAHDPLIEASNSIKVNIKDALVTVTKKLNGHIGSEDGVSVEE